MAEICIKNIESTKNNEIAKNVKSTKGKRGGRREGAGRPKGTSRAYNFRADNELADYIDMQENKTDFIKNCIAFTIRHRDGATDENRLSKFGEVIPAGKVKPMPLPFFDVKIVAGFPIPMNTDELAQDIELLQMLCPHPDSSYLIRVLGDSMIEADVKDGDILIVDKSLRNPSESQIAVCELNGEYTVKHILKDKTGMWLVPANPKYPKIRITDGDDFSIWGVVTYIIHKSR